MIAISMKRERKSRRRVPFGMLVIGAILAFAACFYGIPLLWLFLASTRTESSLLSDPPFTIGSWEAFSRTWHNLTSYNDFQILTWAKNSLIYSAGGVALSLIASIPAGYVLAIYKFPGRKLVLILTLIAMITPSSAIVLPIFLEMNLLHLNNTYIGLILATGFFPFGVYLAYIFYATSLPKGILDSAQVDGCNRFGLFIHMGLPLAKPIVALIAFFSFLANWSNYFLAFVLLSDDKLYNLPVGLTALISGSGALSNSTASEIPIRMPEAIQASILVIAPVLVIFLISQKFVRTGMLSGAEKG
jgi:multiple sugar transport system permease protein